MVLSGGKAEDKDLCGSPGQRFEGQIPGGDIPVLSALTGDKLFNFFLGTFLKDEVLKILTVQKQTWAGRWTRFSVSVTTGDLNGHVSLDV